MKPEVEVVEVGGKCHLQSVSWETFPAGMLLTVML